MLHTHTSTLSEPLLAVAAWREIFLCQQWANDSHESMGYPQLDSPLHGKHHPWTSSWCRQGPSNCWRGGQPRSPRGPRRTSSRRTPPAEASIDNREVDSIAPGAKNHKKLWWWDVMIDQSPGKHEETQPLHLLNFISPARFRQKRTLIFPHAAKATLVCDLGTAQMKLNKSSH